MNNQTLFFLTALGLVAITVLFALNMKFITSAGPSDQKYIKLNDVRGLAVEKDNKLYTLNFKEQKRVIELLNLSQPITGIKPGSQIKPEIQKIIIYQFNNKPDLVLTPITYSDNNLIFTQPEWNKKGYLADYSDGELQQILSQSFDK